MMKKLINLILYGNLNIAFGALALTWQTQLIVLHEIKVDYLSIFAFFSTLFLYALHRVVGLQNVRRFLANERYKVIYQFRYHIYFYAIIAGIGSLATFWYLSLKVQLFLLIPGLISIAYVLPILGKKKRLRDLDHIKIYLIAIIWAIVTVILPVLEYNQAFDLSIMLVFLERALFVFAITLPFDIRDLEVDTHGQVKTIPAQIGIPKTKQLANVLLISLFILVFINSQLGLYTPAIFYGLSFSVLTTYGLIRYSDSSRHDYFYTGLMDGTMLLQFLFVYLSRLVF